MKFPLAERPFAPVRLTSDQCVEMERIVHSMVVATVREYEHFAYINGGRLSKNSWKAIKHRENLTVLRERINKSEIAAAAIRESPFDWSLPKLLMTGTVVGTLDDIMYGTLAPTAEAMRIRSAYVQDEILDAQILSEIQMPTPDEPFRFLGIKWAVRSHSSTLNPMAWPRDTIVVEGTGIHVTPAGDRLGYRVIHSVDLPGCRELKSHGIMRTRTSSTSIFKQLPNGIVDVYMTRFVEPTGSLSESAALGAAAASMLNVWKSVWCSQNKKLSCAAKNGEIAGKSERLVITTDEDGNYCCGLCYKHYKMFNSVITCEACNLMVCSKCQVRRKLARVNKLGEVTQHPVLFCKNCISRSLKDSAFEVAKSECVASPIEEQVVSPVASTSLDETPPIPAPTSLDLEVDLDLDVHHRAHASSTCKRSGHGYNMSVGTNSTFTGSLDGLAILENGHSYFDGTASLDGLDIETVDDWDRVHDASLYEGVGQRLSPSDLSELSRTHRSAYEYDPSNSVDHQQKLWMQMSQLCLAAEETYLLAKKNADAMRHQRPAYS